MPSEIPWIAMLLALLLLGAQYGLAARLGFRELSVRLISALTLSSAQIVAICLVLGAFRILSSSAVVLASLATTALVLTTLGRSEWMEIARVPGRLWRFVFGLRGVQIPCSSNFPCRNSLDYNRSWRFC